MELAAITIPVYKRKDHLIKCINSLKENSLAKDSIIYIYSDFPLDKDFESVCQLREYLKSITGFKKVIIKEQFENKNLQNIVQSIEEPLNKHSKIIYLEEDLVVTSNFLEEMNTALDYYYDNQSIFSVAGYSLPCFSNRNSTYFQSSFSFTAWGCGLWSKKYSTFTNYINQKSVRNRLSENFTLRLKFILNHSLHQYLHYKEKSEINKLTPDLSIGFYLWTEKKVQIFPCNSLVSTNGFDGSGWHCGIDEKFNNQTFNEGSFLKIRYCKNFDLISSENNFIKIKKYHNLNIVQDFKSLLKYFIRKVPFDVNYFLKLKDRK